MWILIVIYLVSTGGQSAGPALNFQEFETQTQCQYALKIINDRTREVWNKNVDGFCIKK